MCYLFTAHLASSFDVINKGNNFSARIFEIVYRVCRLEVLHLIVSLFIAGLRANQWMSLDRDVM